MNSFLLKTEMTSSNGIGLDVQTTIIDESNNSKGPYILGPYLLSPIYYPTLEAVLKQIVIDSISLYNSVSPITPYEPGDIITMLGNTLLSFSTTISEVIIK